MTLAVWWLLGVAAAVVLANRLRRPLRQGRDALARRRQEAAGRGAAAGLAAPCCIEAKGVVEAPRSGGFSPSLGAENGLNQTIMHTIGPI
jgi:hypothetical protein